MERTYTIPEIEVPASVYTKIICPIDFSEASLNAVEYAAKIAQKLSVELYLLNVRPLLFSELIGGNADLLRKTVSDTKKQLDDLCTEINRMLHVSCTSEVLIAYSRFEKIISEEAENKHMIIMGSDGADNLFQYFLGSNTFNVARSVSCPLLLIPETVAYSKLTEAVYLCTEDTSKIHSEKLILFAKQFNLKIILLYLGRDRSDLFKSALNRAEISLSGENIPHEIEHIYSEDVKEEAEQFMMNRQNSVLIIPLEQRNMIERIFKKNSAKKISATANYPVLFIHEEK